MPVSKLFPFDLIQPSQILSEYSEWVYFTLIVIFFISVSGITLRKHFDTPYVKPLIISVGFMLSVGVFMIKGRLIVVLEAWGVLGTVLLVVMASTIPYGLCRGFGMHASKAFYFTYILFYILAWTNFPEVYYWLGDKNLGFVNLALLILFFFSIYKTVKFGKSTRDIASDVTKPTPYNPQIDREIAIQGKELGLENAGKRITKAELNTIDNIAEALTEIERIVETYRNNLAQEERIRISHILREIFKKEDVFEEGTRKVQKIAERISKLDSKKLQELKARMAKASGEDKQIIKAEIEREEEKLKIEKTFLIFQARQDQYLDAFKKHLRLAAEYIGQSSYPYDAKPYLEKARFALGNIFTLLKEMKALEDNLVQHTKAEQRLLRKEREAA